jgi:hypothetical protein
MAFAWVRSPCTHAPGPVNAMIARRAQVAVAVICAEVVREAGDPRVRRACPAGDPQSRRCTGQEQV